MRSVLSNPFASGDLGTVERHGRKVGGELVDGGDAAVQPNVVDDEGLHAFPPDHHAVMRGRVLRAHDLEQSPARTAGVVACRLRDAMQDGDVARAQIGANRVDVVAHAQFESVEDLDRGAARCELAATLPPMGGII